MNRTSDHFRPVGRKPSDDERRNGRLNGQCRNAEAVLCKCLVGVFGSDKPLDRILGGCFRADPRIGSHDRKFIGEGVYAVFRHWGVVRKLLTPEYRESIEGGGELESSAAGALLYAGLLLSGLDFEAMKIYRERYPYRFRLESGDDELTRGAKLLAACGVAEALTEEDLLAPGIVALLSPEIDRANVIRLASERPPIYVRAQGISGEELASSLRASGVENVATVPGLPGTLRIGRTAVNLFTLDEFRGGRMEIQDVASQLIGLVAAPHRRQRWLDLCAGAGGKSLQLADLMERRGTVVACDIRDYKLDDLRKRARRAGVPNIECRAYDGGELPGNWHGKFDGVLVDAPCSCSGVWRRNPDGRWRCRPEAVAEMAALQLSILNRACRGVKICGTLVYATCSMFEQENRGVVEAFLAAHPEFKLMPFAHPATGKPVDGMLQTRMEDFDGDAMFVAKMQHK